MASSRLITLLSGATSSAAPSLTSNTAGQPLPFYTDQAVVCVRSTAGSGTMNAPVVMWGFNPEIGRWFSIGSLNGGTAIPEVSTADTIAYAEQVAGLRAFTRIYAELGTLGGSSTAITVEVICIKAQPVTSS